MPERSATARWEGGLKDGKGTMRLGSGAFEGQYSFSSRFEEGTGTNPEELIGAAHAGCFSMALSGGLERAGHPPTSIDTSARVHLERADERLSHLAHRAHHDGRGAGHRRRRLRGAGGDGQGELPGLPGPRRRRHQAGRPAGGLTVAVRIEAGAARARATKELEHEVHLADDGAARGRRRPRSSPGPRPGTPTGPSGRGPGTRASGRPSRASRSARRATTTAAWPGHPRPRWRSSSGVIPSRRTRPSCRRAAPPSSRRRTAAR